MKRILMLIPGLILWILQAMAQEKDSLPGGAGQFKLGVFYASYLHFYGRSDSLESSGFFPVGEIWLDGKFYITATPVFTMTDGHTAMYAGTVLMTGYRGGKENRSGWNIYAAKPIYKNKSELAQAALKWQFAGSITWINKAINLTGGADVKLSEEMDYGFQAGLDHIFRTRIKKNVVLLADPSLFLYSGTQQFTKSSVKETRFLLFPPLQQEITETRKRFSILSYEISIPLVWAKEKFQVIVSPSYVIPKNLAGENGRNKFYGLMGAKFIF